MCLKQSVLGAMIMPENDLETIDFGLISKKAKILAKQIVVNMQLPQQIELPKTINTLGPKLKKIYGRHYENAAKDISPKKLSQIVAKVLKTYWESCHTSGETMRLQFQAMGYETLNAAQQQVSTGEGYADNEGWAYTLYNNAFSQNDGNNKKNVLIIMALYWLSKADSLVDSAEKYDYIAEALDALELSSGNYMWEAGYECKSEDISHEKSLAAKKAHREIYQLKSEAKSYWLSNIDPKLSNDAAATQLMVIVPLTLRTLSSYVSEFKKEIQSASKA